MTAPLAIPRNSNSFTKRSRSRSSNSLNLSPVHDPSEESQVQETRNTNRIPAFLRQTRSEIQIKFTDLEWRQRNRLSQALDPSSRWAQQTDREVKARNRYLNVQAWANHRIHLKVPEGSCDYINASPISLRSSKTSELKNYIATQGPKQGQFNHFWRMIWNETNDVAVVVMLTQTIEAGREKCFQYFPVDSNSDPMTINGEDEFGDGFEASLKLLEVSFQAASRTTVRKLLLSVGKESKTVWHLLFSGWPDFSIPEGEDREALLELIKLSAEKNTVSDNPRIIHCSAGVGRSGTFISFDLLLAELAEGAMATVADDTDPVFDTVNNLREQRMTMVQSDAQFNFIYQVLKEQWIRRNTSITPKAVEQEPIATDGDHERSPKIPRLSNRPRGEMAETTELPSVPRLVSPDRKSTNA
ncbi:MAG: hypothetical protein M1827_000210 [Pycnora praestabilis]|nr:MAG: hypothetical protein M1827_000210 [Pycnora praestabilis]